VRMTATIRRNMGRSLTERFGSSPGVKWRQNRRKVGTSTQSHHLPG